MHKSELHNVHTFSSPAEFGKFCLDNGVENTSGQSKWYGYISGVEAAKMAISGDDSQVAAAEKLIEKFSLNIDRLQVMDMPSVAGCYPCVPDAIMGEPESMREPMHVESDSAPISIVVDTVCSGGFSAKEMQERGTAILAAVMALAATRPVSLKIISNMDGRKNSEGDGFSFVVIDMPTAPLDIASSAYLLTHIGFTRRLCYDYARRFMGSGIHWPDYKGLGMGDTETQEYEDKVRHYLEIDNDVLYVPPAFLTNALIATNPEQWVKEKIAKYSTHEE